MKISQIPTTIFTMNWCLKHSLRILFIPLVLTLTCCNNPTDLGKQLQQGDSFGSVILTDTLTFKTSNILLDSLCIDPLEFFYNNTGANPPTRFNLLVGNYINPEFGKVTAMSYVQFGGYSDIPTLDNTYSCDSIYLTFYYNYNYANGYFPYNIASSNASKYYSEYTYGDTTNLHRLYFYEPSSELSSIITAPTTKTPLDTTNKLGSTIGFYPRPNNTSVSGVNFVNYVNVRINQSLGDRLFANIQADPSGVFTNFKNYFNGLVIVPDANNTSVIGFASRDISSNVFGPFLTLYYSDKFATGTVTGNIKFGGPKSGFTVNNIKARTTGNLASLINPYDSISTDLTNNYCYIQGGSGLSVKASIPNFLSFVNSSPEKLSISNALLIIKRSDLVNFDNGGVDSKLPPPYLTLYALNDQDKLYKYSTTNIWQTVNTDKTSVNPVRAIFDYKTQSYTIDITNYLQNQALTNRTPKFIITAGFNNQLVNGLVFGDSKSLDNPMKLKLYYSRIK